VKTPLCWLDIQPSLSINQTLRLALIVCFCLSFANQNGVAQVIAVTAEIETTFWPPRDAAGDLAENLSSRTCVVRCLVGTGSWLIEGDFLANGKETQWFTGTNIIKHSVITKLPSKDMELYERNHGRAYPHLGQQFTKVIESVDGNPGRPARTEDLLNTPSARICWLAFCAGPCLKREGRHIFPPGDFWKELVSAPAGFSDKTTTFDDRLGMPSSVDLYMTNGQPIMQYRVSRSTNVLGWSFPLEFQLAEYRPARSNGWELHLAAKGHVTAITAGTESQISPEMGTRAMSTGSADRNPPLYILNAGGPRSFVGLTNAPASNRAAIVLARSSDDGVIFRLTNGESHAILLWNVRVQVQATNRGTDGFGWDTVYDDYPMGTPRYNSAHYLPGATGEFSVPHPRATPWRVCILYSTDWADSGNSYSGNYEVISQELKE
jgi:hypothetical protein